MLRRDIEEEDQECQDADPTAQGGPNALNLCLRFEHPQGEKEKGGQADETTPLVGIGKKNVLVDQ